MTTWSLFFYHLDPSTKLSANESDLLVDPKSYKRLIGKLNYLTHTRPQLSFLVQLLSLYMQRPKIPHFNNALRVFQYLQLDTWHGSLLNQESSSSLLAFFMMIGHPLWILDDLLVDTLLTLAYILFRGNKKIRYLCHPPLVRLNIDLCIEWLLNWLG